MTPFDSARASNCFFNSGEKPSALGPMIWPAANSTSPFLQSSFTHSSIRPTTEVLMPLRLDSRAKAQMTGGIPPPFRESQEVTWTMFILLSRKQVQEQSVEQAHFDAWRVRSSFDCLA